jgi:hypothetical protein
MSNQKSKNNFLLSFMQPISNFFTKAKRPQPPKGLGKPKTE